MIHATHRSPNYRNQRGRMGASTGQQGSTEAAGLISSAAPAVALIPGVGPVAAAALQVAAGIVKSLGIGNGCGGSCVAATQVVNAIIPAMQNNLAAAQTQAVSNGGCLTSDEQAQFQSSFRQLWNTIVQDCNQIGGDGGTQCIADRQRGGKYDCFATLLDPITALPVCTTVTGSASVSATSSATTAATASNSTIIAGIPDLAIYAGMGLLAFFLLRPSK